MPDFSLPGGVTTPFGKNQYLRSTRGNRYESYMCAKGSVPAKTIDGAAGQKVLQPGTVMAKITSGGDTGKVGPFQADATDGRQTATNIVGINDTFLPWQLMERDTEVAVMRSGTAFQPWCLEYAAAGVVVALTNATRTAIEGIAELRNLAFDQS